MTTPQHVPVLLDRVVSLLTPALQRPDRDRTVFVDATLGLAGHSEAVLRACPKAHLVGIDRDPHALEQARGRLEQYRGRVDLAHAVYDEIPEVLGGLGFEHADAILFDLGVSSMQLDVRERGFAYAEDAPLDMRMNDTTGQTAADVLNTYSVEDLTRILKSYGEERFARRIAESVVRERAREPFTRSARLVELVRDAIPAPARRTGGHPAKRTFQALRIEVNEELSVLRRAIPAAVDSVAVGGRIVVMSYHSLEDRLVKQAFVDQTRSDVPPDMPFIPEGHEPPLRLLTRGAEKASEPEIAENPRAASVRLRAVERVRPSTGAAA